MVHLPLRSGDGYGLRYSLDIFATQPMTERKLDRKSFDFVLSASRLSRPDLMSVYETDQVHLYKVNGD
jgi:hypothetical protein